jgi:uncharacterized sporulation protein YeaH/YhbH (DUF444 family)
MPSVIIDRRLSGGGKNTPNRRKFMERVKDLIKQGVRDVVRSTDIKDLTGSGNKSIKIPKRTLGEPTFQHNGSGTWRRVVTGNDRFRVGDKIDRPNQNGNGKGKGASQDGEGEDSFTFHLTREEFYDYFFENCELPDMVKQSLQKAHTETMQRAGFVNSGSPASLNTLRSMRSAKARVSGLGAKKKRKVKELEEQLRLAQQAIAESGSTPILEEEVDKLTIEIGELKQKLSHIPFLDPIDLKYNNWTKEIQPTTQAVMICLLDVSGSMDELKKELAKTFHLLLMLFLEKEYQRVDVRFVIYHTTAEEVDADEFYYGRRTGGTLTSSGLNVVSKIINEDYPIELWNIYVAHCSDGDNWESDNQVCASVLSTQILPLVQMYAYVEVNPTLHQPSWYTAQSETLMHLFDGLKQTHPNVSTQLVQQEKDVYPVFKKLFERKSNG